MERLSIVAAFVEDLGLRSSKSLEDGVFYGLAAAYALLCIAALIQLVRIQIRVPEYGWTTQKVFHLLNFFVNGVRAAVFLFRRQLQYLKPEILQPILLDLPGLLFFTTYALLVLFWAEIYRQAKNLPAENLRPVFVVINCIVYIVQLLLWVIYWLKPVEVILTISKLFFAGVSLLAAFGFLVYGGRLFMMLRRFPIESKGRQKKLHEVGGVTGICFACFTIRTFILAFSTFEKNADLDVLYHPFLNVLYYSLVEILPSALVLFILRKLPPKRLGGGNQYHAIDRQENA
ncbi:hypothetical protein SELMODRAFT_445368 [Selaginella moellendorffii]|uniref:THH1/TOM1/TOM3 domain-containing protein n=1 Tax=Selaginella moellendorffii TaxID=88036 RepID=D8SI11_SELML|nr:tobamovirus multiplication protein 3 [Selaginella moellendorffii]EFJ15891.1 hypothetical protein SELMODRAFT_445368 [Selaginella moellendorffii]|eukprot:XP_002983082.1 tobamovirus multiplication protein 3 [Selaginella moellendorffii]